MSSPKNAEVLGQGSWLRLLSRGGWEFVERIGSRGVVMIVAVTDEGRLVLVEQYRPAVQARVIELPAGLVGDEAGHEDEALEDAARRELREETGYEAGTMERLTSGTVSPGSSCESVHVLRARDLRKIGEGGGVGAEDIRVHEVPLQEVETWLRERGQEDVRIDLKVWAARTWAGAGRPSRS
ncbi:MAG: NUDIX hydrolase [Deltaproteobacteria bacterium]|nr:NUDIX hydrolase [Deltaproteobacteria bacterium]MBW2413166.1 NUDIX hydrolase [Deltaproteobacteria bacterium]